MIKRRSVVSQFERGTLFHLLHNRFYIGAACRGINIERLRPAANLVRQERNFWMQRQGRDSRRQRRQTSPETNKGQDR